jgi:hypothetical protein
VAVLIRVLGDLVVIVMLVIAARADRKSGTPRDILHWYGFWLELAYHVMVIVATIFFIVFFALVFIISDSICDHLRLVHGHRNQT